MNDTITTMLESEIPYQDPTARWGTLSTLYAQAIDTHIPKQTLQPKQPWITQTTLNLLERRGQLRQQGDLAQVAELNKTIRKAAKLDKRKWLEERLSTDDWRPITNLKKPFPHKAFTLINGHYRAGTAQEQRGNFRYSSSHQTMAGSRATARTRHHTYLSESSDHF